MADLVQRVKDLATRVGTEFKAVRQAISDARGLAQSALDRPIIDDSATGSDRAWSAAKVAAAIAAAVQQTKDAILGGAAGAYDTLGEIQALLQSDDTLQASLSQGLASRVRFDAAQTLTAAQKTTACSNIGIGEPDTDFVATFNAALV
jgi:hypothetical protein